MEVIPTTNAPLISRLFSTPYIYAAMSDDSSPDLKDFDFNRVINNWIFLEVRRYHNSPAVGVFMYVPIKPDTAEVHTMMTKDCRGRDAIEAGRKSIEWIFANTEFTKITSYAYSDSPEVEWYARKCGLVKTSQEPWKSTRQGKAVEMSKFEVLKT